MCVCVWERDRARAIAKDREREISTHRSYADNFIAIFTISNCIFIASKTQWKSWTKGSFFKTVFRIFAEVPATLLWMQVCWNELRSRKKIIWDWMRLRPSQVTIVSTNQRICLWGKIKINKWSPERSFFF